MLTEKVIEKERNDFNMTEVGIVHGSKEQSKELIVGTDTVYVHSNIKPIETDDGSEIYEYNETQYTKDEYIHLLAEKNTSLEKEITSTQLALCDVYELLE